MIELLIPLFIAVVSPWVTVQLSLRQFRSQRWWEKKTELYGQLLDALHGMCRHFSDHLDAEETSHDITEVQKTFLNALFKNGYDKIKHLHDIGGLFFPRKVTDSIHNFLKEIDRIGRRKDVSFFEMMDTGAFVTKKCIEEVLRLAKQDLAAVKEPQFHGRD